MKTIQRKLNCLSLNIIIMSLNHNQESFDHGLPTRNYYFIYKLKT